MRLVTYFKGKYNVVDDLIDSEYTLRAQKYHIVNSEFQVLFVGHTESS